MKKPLSEDLLIIKTRLFDLANYCSPGSIVIRDFKRVFNLLEEAYNDDTPEEFITGVALFNERKGEIVISMSKPYRHGSLFAALDGAATLYFDKPEHPPLTQGFVTNYGRFLDRTEAKKLAVANGQFMARPDNEKFTELFSEDVW